MINAHFCSAEAMSDSRARQLLIKLLNFAWIGASRAANAACGRHIRRDNNGITVAGFGWASKSACPAKKLKDTDGEHNYACCSDGHHHACAFMFESSPVDPALCPLVCLVYYSLSEKKGNPSK